MQLFLDRPFLDLEIGLHICMSDLSFDQHQTTPMWDQALPRLRNLVAPVWSQDASGSGNQAAQVWGQAAPFLGFRLYLCVMLMLLDPEISLHLYRKRPLLSLAIGLYMCGARPLQGPEIRLYLYEARPLVCLAISGGKATPGPHSACTKDHLTSVWDRKLVVLMSVCVLYPGASLCNCCHPTPIFLYNLTCL